MSYPHSFLDLFSSTLQSKSGGLGSDRRSKKDGYEPRKDCLLPESKKSMPHELLSKMRLTKRQGGGGGEEKGPDECGGKRRRENGNVEEEEEKQSSLAEEHEDDEEEEEEEAFEQMLSSFSLSSSSSTFSSSFRRRQGVSSLLSSSSSSASSSASSPFFSASSSSPSSPNPSPPCFSSSFSSEHSRRWSSPPSLQKGWSSPLSLFELLLPVSALFLLLLSSLCFKYFPPIASSSLQPPPSHHKRLFSPFLSSSSSSPLSQTDSPSPHPFFFSSSSLSSQTILSDPKSEASEASPSSSLSFPLGDLVSPSQSLSPSLKVYPFLSDEHSSSSQSPSFPFPSSLLLNSFLNFSIFSSSSLSPPRRLGEDKKESGNRLVHEPSLESSTSPLLSVPDVDTPQPGVDTPREQDAVTPTPDPSVSPPPLSPSPPHIFKASGDEIPALPEDKRENEGDPSPSPTGGTSTPVLSTLAFCCFLFFTAVFLQWLVSKIPIYPPPVSIVWFVFGMVVYAIASAPALLPPQPSEDNKEEGRGGGQGKASSVGISEDRIIRNVPENSSHLYLHGNTAGNEANLIHSLQANNPTGDRGGRETAGREGEAEGEGEEGENLSSIMKGLNSNNTGIGMVPLHGYNILQTGILEMRVIDSNVVYFVLVPILLYEATQSINWHKFKRFLAGGLVLAVLGVAVQVGLLGVMFYYTYMKQYVKSTGVSSTEQSPWTAAFLLASTLSSTDPVAVLSVLNAVNASDKLCTMFDGESLINDGSAVLLFQFFFFLLQGVTESPISTFIMFVKLLFAGPAFGCVLGFAVYLWLNCFRKYPMTQCLAVVTVCYIAYFVAEVACGLSGPLTAVCYGLFIKSYGHIALDREAQAKHHTFVEGRGTEV
ncbi:na+ h+ exchanger [Cystoisospora suis]|uniref:Na+ h+ exchanger n=1 Tax=Cystoisospora suis TaxID=483139 RepID=A0A2C6KIM7_9APIC|nr:na+ h+ exchanger [Cystoisospora suis]